MAAHNVSQDLFLFTFTDLTYLTSAWHGNGTVDLSWDGLFVSSSPLYFEVSIGTILGGSDVMQWVETMNTDACIAAGFSYRLLPNSHGYQCSRIATDSEQYYLLCIMNAIWALHFVKFLLFFKCS